MKLCSETWVAGTLKFIPPPDIKCFKTSNDNDALTGYCGENDNAKWFWHSRKATADLEDWSEEEDPPFLN